MSVESGGVKEVHKWGFVKKNFEIGKVFLVANRKKWGGNSSHQPTYTTDLLFTSPVVIASYPE